MFATWFGFASLLILPSESPKQVLKCMSVTDCNFIIVPSIAFVLLTGSHQGMEFP